MAKSLRCKHRIKMRNVKRQHYAKKDLERLKKLAAKSAELMDVVTLKSAAEIKEKTIDQGTSAGKLLCSTDHSFVIA
uniref:Uncharacterized protein n=1 Tax=Arion vulgaris TaxID=1028688 RepID=A0A0B6YUL6_9EUPU